MLNPPMFIFYQPIYIKLQMFKLATLHVVLYWHSMRQNADPLQAKSMKGLLWHCAPDRQS